MSTEPHGTYVLMAMRYQREKLDQKSIGNN